MHGTAQCIANLGARSLLELASGGALVHLPCGLAGRLHNLHHLHLRRCACSGDLQSLGRLSLHLATSPSTGRSPVLVCWRSEHATLINGDFTSPLTSSSSANLAPCQHAYTVAWCHVITSDYQGGTVVISICYMAFLFEGDAHKLWFISCHVFWAATVQIPLLLALHQISLQSEISSTKIWSPFKCGSFWFTFITRNSIIFRNPSHNAFRNRIFPNFTKSDKMASFHAVEACNNRLFRQNNRLFFWQLRKWLWKLVLLVLWIKT